LSAQKSKIQTNQSRMPTGCAAIRWKSTSDGCHLTGELPMTEAATVLWHSTEMFKPEPHSKISRGRDRQFESVENAVRFVMETLSDGDRATAMIQTDNRSIHLDDIVAIYGGLQPRTTAPTPKE
jgi:hypothetical protein